MIYEKFQSYHLIITGDMNTRIGTIKYDRLPYQQKENPDNTINSNGKKLLELIHSWSRMVVLNGLMYKGKEFDTDFTCYRGTRRSQNDITLCNVPEIIEQFRILQKFIYSDHCPIMLSCTLRRIPSLDIVYKCSKDLFSYDHLDVNKRILPPIKLCRLNVRNTVDMLDERATVMINSLNQNINNDNLSMKITNMIYDVCKSNYRREILGMDDIENNLPNLRNCSSKNFKAIAEAHLYTFNVMSDIDPYDDNRMVYLENWVKFQNLSRISEDKELNIRINKTWKNSKGNSKKMWSLIDWKGNAVKPLRRRSMKPSSTLRMYSNQRK